LDISRKCSSNTVNVTIEANYRLQPTHYKKPLKMLQKNLDNSYFIEYSNYFEFEGKTFSFRKKELFDITSMPKHIELKNNNNCFGYWINRKWLSLSSIQDILKKEPKKVDVSNLQWYDQIKLDHVFNLN
jgi:hypothetical protein